MERDDVIICPVPSLVATLWRLEQDKGEPLTEQEVIKIRDECPCVAVTPAQLQRLIEQRQYEDIDPEDVWHEWQRARLELIEWESEQSAAGDADKPRA